MTEALIAAGFNLALAAAFFAYWVRRLDRRHRERMAVIAAAEEDDRGRRETYKREREEAARRLAELEAELEAARAREDRLLAGLTGRR